MRVPVRVYADETLLATILDGEAMVQLANVAMLPGVVECVYGMPDMHEGYGFPVGGLAEEAPFTYKDVDRVAEVVECAGLARRVARLRPLGVIKG